MILQEIVGLDPYPYKWIDSNRCVFEYESAQYGIFLNENTLNLESRSIDIVNISFGLIKDENFNESTINTDLTNFGNPRKVLSTVAKACIENKLIYQNDIISFAASDQAKERRLLIYQFAIAEIRSKNEKFNLHNDIKIKTANNTICVLLSKIKFTEAEQKFIIDNLNIIKI